VVGLNKLGEGVFKLTGIPSTLFVSRLGLHNHTNLQAGEKNASCLYHCGFIYPPCGGLYVLEFEEYNPCAAAGSARLHERKGEEGYETRSGRR
jgi:hypothetical protein